MSLSVERPEMKKGRKPNRYLSWPAVALVLFALAHPVFHEYQDLSHSDIFASNHVESLHPEDLSATRDDHHYTGDLVISALPDMIPMMARGFHPLPVFLNSYPDQQGPILRC